MVLQSVRSKSPSLITVQRAVGCVILFCATLTAHASKVVVTITGTVTNGNDGFGIFGVGPNLEGQPFTFTMAFDDAVGHDTSGTGCATPYASASGSSSSSPATGVLTIGKGSYTFGEQANSKWQAFRNVASSCSDNYINLIIYEGQESPRQQVVQFTLMPASGKPPMTTSIDWHSPLAATEYERWSVNCGFAIVRPSDFSNFSKGYFLVKTVTIE